MRSIYSAPDLDLRINQLAIGQFRQLDVKAADRPNQEGDDQGERSHRAIIGSARGRARYERQKCGISGFVGQVISAPR